MWAAIYFSLYFAYISPIRKNEAVIGPQNEASDGFVFAVFYFSLFGSLTI